MVRIFELEILSLSNTINSKIPDVWREGVAHLLIDQASKVIHQILSYLALQDMHAILPRKKLLFY